MRQLGLKASHLGSNELSGLRGAQLGLPIISAENRVFTGANVPCRAPRVSEGFDGPIGSPQRLTGTN